MSQADGDFDSWLGSRLKQLELDDEVFSGYITGMLDADESSVDEMVEALAELLTEATVRTTSMHIS